MTRRSRTSGPAIAGSIEAARAISWMAFRRMMPPSVSGCAPTRSGEPERYSRTTFRAGKSAPCWTAGRGGSFPASAAAIVGKRAGMTPHLDGPDDPLPDLHLHLQPEARNIRVGRNPQIQQVETGILAFDVVVRIGHDAEVREAGDFHQGVGNPSLAGLHEVLFIEADAACVERVWRHVQQVGLFGRERHYDVEGCEAIAGHRRREDFTGRQRTVGFDHRPERIDAPELGVDVHRLSLERGCQPSPSRPAGLLLPYSYLSASVGFRMRGAIVAGRIAEKIRPTTHETPKATTMATGEIGILMSANN